MGTGAGLEQANDSTPDRPAEQTGQNRDDQVDAGGQLHSKRHPAGGPSGDEHLPTTTDVEHAHSKGESDAEPGRDQRRGKREGLGQRSNGCQEVRGSKVVDGALEQGRVRPGHGLPDGSDQVGRPGKEVSGGFLHPIGGERDQYRADHEGEQHREHGDHGAAAGDVTQRLGPPFRAVLLHLARS